MKGAIFLANNDVLLVNKTSTMNHLASRCFARVHFTSPGFDVKNRNHHSRGSPYSFYGHDGNHRVPLEQENPSSVKRHTLFFPFGSNTDRIICIEY